MTTMMMLRIGGGMMRIAIEIIIPPMVKKMVVMVSLHIMIRSMGKAILIVTIR